MSDLLTTIEAAAHVRLSKRTLEEFRQKGGGPKFRKLARKVYYRQSDLDDWVDPRSFRSTSEYPNAA